jgi:hypothetical protein
VEDDFYSFSFSASPSQSRIFLHFFSSFGFFSVEMVLNRILLTPFFRNKMCIRHNAHTRIVCHLAGALFAQ